MHCGSYDAEAAMDARMESLERRMGEAMRLLRVATRLELVVVHHHGTSIGGWRRVTISITSQATCE